MKKTVIKIVVIFIFLISYCFIETLFLHKFTEKMYQMVLDIQQESNEEEILNLYHQMKSYVEEKQLLLDIMVLRTEMEMIHLSLGRVGDYIAEKQNFEARVAAGEIVAYLLEINGSLDVKK